MDGLFLKVLEMSIMGSVVILITMLARFLLKNRSKRFIMILWAVVAIRLLVPVSLESSFSIFNFIPLKTQTLTAVTKVSDADMPDNMADTQAVKADSAADTKINLSEKNINIGNKSLFLNLKSADPLPGIKTVLPTVWLIGALGIAVFCSVQYAILKIKLRNARNISGNVYVSEKIGTPFVFGFFVPRIYLPDVLEDHEKEYVLLHERTHIKHVDWLIKIIGMSAAAVHWFNPLVWLAFTLFERDIEMCCDESVVAGMDADLKKAYTMSIVSFAKQSSNKRYLVTPLGFSKPDYSKTEVTNRVNNLINYKKGTTATAVAITAILLFVGVICGFSSKTNADEAEGIKETTLVETTVAETTTATTTAETTPSEAEETDGTYDGVSPLWDREIDGPKSIAEFANHQVGTPYVSGGDSPDKGFDETGLILYLHKEKYAVGFPLKGGKIDSDFGMTVSKDKMVAGDLVFYESGIVAIYVGDGKVVYASKAKGCVTTGDLDMEKIKVIKQVISYSNSEEGLG